MACFFLLADGRRFTPVAPRLQDADDFDACCAWITALRGQESQRERVSIVVKRRGLRLSQRFELGQQGLVEPGEVHEENHEERRDGSDQQPATTSGTSRRRITAQ